MYIYIMYIMWWFSCFKSALWTWTHDDSWIDCWFGHLWRSEALHLHQQRPLIQHQHRRKIYGDGPKLVMLTSWNKECMSMNRNSFHVNVGYRGWTQQFEKNARYQEPLERPGMSAIPTKKRGNHLRKASRYLAFASAAAFSWEGNHVASDKSYHYQRIVVAQNHDNIYIHGYRCAKISIQYMGFDVDGFRPHQCCLGFEMSTMKRITRMDFLKWFQVEFPLYLKPQLDHGAGAISTC
jgi:hypothetical protein